MRWLALWLFLTAAWVVGWAVSQIVFGDTVDHWSFTVETAGHLIAVPLAQVAALWGVSRFRRMFRPHSSEDEDRPDDGRGDRS